MYPEKRKEERSALTRQPRGKLQILSGDGWHPVFEVVDVSTMGLRIRVDTQMDVGENALIRYQAEEVDLKLNGIVVWSDGPAEPNGDANFSGHAIGIKLTGPSLLQSFW